jgi:glutamyl-tRNA reductase
MEILCVGLSHHTAPIEVRERFAVPDGQLAQAAAELSHCRGLSEASSSRPATASNFTSLPSALSMVWRRFRNSSPHAPPHRKVTHSSDTSLPAQCGTFSKSSADSDSMVLGETEILGQVEESLRRCQRGRRQHRDT